MLTADTITDAQIRELRCQCNETRPCATHRETNALVVVALGQHRRGSTRPHIHQRDARARCAEILNARVEKPPPPPGCQHEWSVDEQGTRPSDFPKSLWIGFIQQLTYVSERDLPKLEAMTCDQLALIEELLHSQAVKLTNRLAPNQSRKATKAGA